ncbi:MAG TPA: hypothetical protein VI298_06110 [Geobacteraceae bacterium]
MGADIFDFMEYLKKKNEGTKKLTVSLDDMKAFCRLDDASVSWISSLFAFAKYTLFLKTLFHNNNSRTGNRNTGFLIGFKEDHIECLTESICSALTKMERSFRVVDAAEKSYIEIIGDLTGLGFSTNYAAYEALKELLYESNDVIVVERFSLCTSPSKAGRLRDWIKTIDDAHIKGIVPKGELILIDYANFLQKTWDSVGPYLSILAYSDESSDMFS